MTQLAYANIGLLHTVALVQSGNKPMWVLIYVFSYSVNPVATNDRAEWRLLPTVVFQEFSNEKRCRAAKAKIEETL